ncbi:MAG TPA: hypothetical protein VIJ93_11050, partial [bacterium]
LLGCLIFITLAGCVSIYDSTQVKPPEQVDQFPRNVLDKCPPHVYPSRMIKAEMGMGVTLFQYGALVIDQANFDNNWNNVTPSLDPEHQQTYSLKPVIDWDHENAYFMPLHLTNSCQKVKSFGMETDCYNITFLLYQYVEGENCSTRSTDPVYIYIYPKTSWPFLTRWLKTPDYTPTPGT